MIGKSKKLLGLLFVLLLMMLVPGSMVSAEENTGFVPTEEMINALPSDREETVIEYYEEYKEPEVNKKQSNNSKKSSILRNGTSAISSEYLDTLSRNDEEEEYYYTKLDNTQKEIYKNFEIILNAVHGSKKYSVDLKKKYFSVNIYNLDKYKIPASNEVYYMSIIYALKSDHPEWYWAYPNYGIGLSGDIISSLSIKGNPDFATAESRADIEEKILAKVSQYEEIISSDMSDYLKEKIIHDKLCRETIYDSSAKNAHSIIGTLVDGYAVCESYALTSQLLFDYFGIESIYTGGDNKDGKGAGAGHAWNQVKIDGKWYNFDATWDDYSEQFINDSGVDLGSTMRLENNYFFFNRSDSNFRHVAEYGGNYKLDLDGEDCPDDDANYYNRSISKDVVYISEQDTSEEINSKCVAVKDYLPIIDTGDYLIRLAADRTELYSNFESAVIEGDLFGYNPLESGSREFFQPVNGIIVAAESYWLLPNKDKKAYSFIPVETSNVTVYSGIDYISKITNNSTYTLPIDRNWVFMLPKEGYVPKSVEYSINGGTYQEIPEGSIYPDNGYYRCIIPGVKANDIVRLKAEFDVYIPEPEATDMDISSKEGITLIYGKTTDIEVALSCKGTSIALDSSNVKLYFDSIEQKNTVVFADGKAKLSLTMQQLQASDTAHEVKAVFSGDTEYAACEKTLNITVAKKNVTITADNLSITEGETKEFSFSSNGYINMTGQAEAYTGTCMYKIIGTDKITTTMNRLPAGTYKIVPYGCDAGTNFKFTYNEGTLTVSAKPTADMSISSSAGNALVYGDTTNIEATLSYKGAAVSLDNSNVKIYLNNVEQNGTVQNGVQQGTVTFSNGKAVLALTMQQLQASDTANEVKAVFSGNAAYAACEKTLNITVAKKNVTITADNLSITEGETKEFSFSSNGYINMTGQAEVYTGTCQYKITDGTNEITTPMNQLAVGTYRIVPYGCDAGTNFEFTYDEGTLTVSAKPAADMSISSSAGNDLVYGDTTNIEATLSYKGAPIALNSSNVKWFFNAIEQNEVQFTNGNVILPLTMQQLQATDSSYEIKVVFSGDDIYATCEKALYITVAKKTVTITADDLTITEGETEDFGYWSDGFINSTIGNAEPFTGICQFRITDGTNEITTPMNQLGVGTYKIVPYGCDAGTNFEFRYTEGTLTVSAKPTADMSITSSTGNDLIYGDTTNVEVSLLYNGLPIEINNNNLKLFFNNIEQNGTVQNGVQQGTVTFSNGKAVLALTMQQLQASDTVYEVKAVFSGDTAYSACEKILNITVAKKNVVITADGLTITEGETKSYSFTSNGYFNSTTGLTEAYAGICQFKIMDGINEITTPMNQLAVGTYRIVPYGCDAGDNFEFAYVEGTLTVSAKSTSGTGGSTGGGSTGGSTGGGTSGGSTGGGYSGGGYSGGSGSDGSTGTVIIPATQQTEETVEVNDPVTPEGNDEINKPIILDKKLFVTKKTLYFNGTTGNLFTLSPTVTESNKDYLDKLTITYKSANKKIAKVNKKTGQITAVKSGSTTITATVKMPDGSTKKYPVKITVKKAAIKLKLSDKDITAGEKITVKATLTGYETKGMYWTVSNKKIASVKKRTGKTSTILTALSKGKAYVTVYVKDTDGKYISQKIKITVK